MGNNTRHEKYQQLTELLIKEGCPSPKFQILPCADNNDQLTVHAQTEIQKNDTLLRYPLSLALTSEKAKTSEIGEKIIASGVKLRYSKTCLAAFIMQERQNSQSFWKSYLDTLPKDLSHIPIYFDEHKLSFLKGTTSARMVMELNQFYKEEYNNLCAAIPDFSLYSYEEFKWALATVTSRSFEINVHGVETTVLVPMLDVLNHKNSPNVSINFSNEADVFEMTSLKKVSSGQELFALYGSKSNTYLFVTYGFIIESNEEDTATTPLSLSNSDPYFLRKKDLLKGKINNIFNLTKFNDDEFKKCVETLRILNADFCSKKDGSVMDFKKPVSIEDEKKVLVKLIAICKGRMGLFDTTFEEDQKILSDENSPYNKNINIRNAIHVRAGEKKTLNTLIEQYRVCLILLNMSWSDVEILMPEYFEQHWNSFAYIKDAIIPLLKDNEIQNSPKTKPNGKYKIN